MMAVENSAYIIMSGVKSKMKEMEYLSSEVTKTDVIGHKREKFIYDEYKTNGVSYSEEQDLATYRDVSDGNVKLTKEPLDLAIRGDAYFSFETENGVRYGKAGHMTTNNEGAIVDMNGHRLLDANGQPIILENGTIGMSVGKNGIITAGGEELQQIGMFTFENTQLMIKEGQNLYAPGINPVTQLPQVPILAEEAQMLQGALEESNVNRIEAITDTINVQRAIGLMTGILGSFDELERNAVKTLTKTN